MRNNFFAKKEYLHTNAYAQMLSPYRRVLLMHVVILLGAMVVWKANAPLYAVVLLLVVKTILDLFDHLREHGFINRGREILSSPS